MRLASSALTSIYVVLIALFLSQQILADPVCETIQEQKDELQKKLTGMSMVAASWDAIEYQQWPLITDPDLLFQVLPDSTSPSSWSKQVSQKCQNEVTAIAKIEESLSRQIRVVEEIRTRLYQTKAKRMSQLEDILTLATRFQQQDYSGIQQKSQEQQNAKEKTPTHHQLLFDLLNAWHEADEYTIDNFNRVSRLWRAAVDALHRAPPHTTLQLHYQELSLLSLNFRSEQFSHLSYVQLVGNKSTFLLIGTDLIYEIRHFALNVRNLIWNDALFIEVWQEEKEYREVAIIWHWLWHLMVVIGACWLMIKFSKKIAHSLISSQQLVYKSKLGDNRKKTISVILRLIKPNARWIFLLLLGGGLKRFLPDSPWLTLYVVLIVTAACYSLLWMLLEWAVDRMYDRARLALALTIDQQSEKQARRIALVFSIVGVVSYFIHNTVKQGYLLSVIFVCIGLMVWLIIYRFVVQHKMALLALTKLRFRESLYNSALHAFEGRLRGLIAPILFVTVELADLLIVWNTMLLNFEFYQTFTARWLKIRLERGLEEEVGNDTPDTDSNYNRWFNSDPPGEISKLWIDTPFIQELEQSVNTLLESGGEDNTLIVTGDHGMGKTICLDIIMSRFDLCRIIHIRITEKVTTAEALFTILGESLGLPISKVSDIVLVDQASDKTIVIIDGLQNCFISDINGFEAFKILISLTNAKTQNLFWLLCSSQHAWSYLYNVFRSNHYLTNHKKVPRWSQQEIRELILKRHSASRRKLVYNELLLNAATLNESGSVRTAETRCFHMLWDQSSGNPSVALGLWRAATSVQEKFVIEVGVPQRPDTDKLSGLSDELMFVFASLLIHGSLTSVEAIRATHMDESIIRRALKVGRDIGFVRRLDDGRYTIADRWYYPLSNLLSNRNMLHG